jgi:signal transduction histidine kinase
MRFRLTAFTVVQINVDLVILTLMLHFSGGATNPFILYYFFHTILSSILLPKHLAYLEALAASLLFGAMVAGEGVGFISHYDLLFREAWNTPTFMFGMWSALTSALFIAVYMAESIMDRLRMHQDELERALARTARLETEKSRFLGMVAHDLKSPLASIETMATSVLAVYGGSIPLEVRKMLERIPARTDELLRLIGEVLDFSRIRNVADLDVPFAEVDLAAVAKDTVEAHTGQAAEKRITLTFTGSPGEAVVPGNGELLERMAANLVSNALRYTPEGGSVAVTVGLRGSDAVLTVADTGIGIPPEDIKGIFTDFFRAKNARAFSRSGTGLGLSIVRSIAEMHHGGVTVRSTVGSGTTFEVVLPAAKGEGSLSRPPAQ